MTNTAYFEITELTDEEFADVQAQINPFVALKKYIPDFKAYITVITHGGKLYHVDTGYSDDPSTACKLVELYHNIHGFKQIHELPTKVEIREVVAPDHYSESLLLKLVNATAHPFLGRGA